MSFPHARHSLVLLKVVPQAEPGALLLVLLVVVVLLVLVLHEGVSPQSEKDCCGSLSPRRRAAVVCGLKIAGVGCIEVYGSPGSPG